ncbi:GIY-YIG nuclease family protein [Pseudalkalibacillus caeni]|uniref:GIY-YIG nuclease family protein n=1 Tax=Exobacillus caeni TaxID=2574798 RepID=A0A5R9EY29_9BACL|nr:GIY-YIG nuclease family protein [Pseudalkalibacillus caeni]TLS35096.1 GIY-YIG nuclease family protein [Pseudalkalibacillus caeni]
MDSNNHYVYMLECADGTYYTGYTNQLEKRLSLHQRGKGAKYTRGRSPVELVYKNAFRSKGEALKEEYRIKQLTRKQKEQLIREGNNAYEDATELSE